MSPFRYLRDVPRICPTKTIILLSHNDTLTSVDLPNVVVLLFVLLAIENLGIFFTLSLGNVNVPQVKGYEIHPTLHNFSCLHLLVILQLELKPVMNVVTQ